MIGLILVAAGAGTRFGSDLPKQFHPLEGKALYLHSLERLSPHCSRMALVVPRHWQKQIASELADHSLASRTSVVAGGETRQDSVYAGMQQLTQADIILVHDAVRPWVSNALIERVIKGAQQEGACIPGLPVAETVKRVAVGDGHVLETLDRSVLRLAQTPQGFQRDLLQRAFEKARRDGFCGTDEAALVERMGEKVLVVEGDPANVKVTWPADLDV